MGTHNKFVGRDIPHTFVSFLLSLLLCLSLILHPATPSLLSPCLSLSLPPTPSLSFCPQPHHSFSFFLLPHLINLFFCLSTPSSFLSASLPWHCLFLSASSTLSLSFSPLPHSATPVTPPHLCHCRAQCGFYHTHSSPLSALSDPSMVNLIWGEFNIAFLNISDFSKNLGAPPRLWKNLYWVSVALICRFRYLQMGGHTWKTLYKYIVSEDTDVFANLNQNKRTFSLTLLLQMIMFCATSKKCYFARTDRRVEVLEDIIANSTVLWVVRRPRISSTWMAPIGKRTHWRFKAFL